MSSLFLLISLVGVGLFFSLAYLAERERPLRWVVYLVLASLDALALLIGLPYALLGRLPGARDALAAALAGSGLSMSAAVVANLAAALPWFGVLSVVVGLVGLALLLSPVRRVIARIVPVDADRPVHTVALELAVHIVGMSAAVALLLPVVAGDQAALDSLSRASSDAGLAPLWAQSLGFVVLAALGVGLGVQRDLPGVLARLGLSRRLHWRWWIVATLLALASGVVVDHVWSLLNHQSLAEVERISEALFTPYLRFGLWGALTIALSAGIGEEILFRGAAQPRLGLLFTSLLFAVVHTQYTISLALVQVLIVGLVLGLTRRHTNTTTAIATHATYNLVLALLAILPPRLSP